MINDLTLIEIPPLNDDEASLMIDRLCLGLKEESITLNLSSDVKAHLLKRIVQNLPYYIQMIIDELVDEGIEEVSENDIDQTLDNIVKSHANADYFSNWKTRLGDAFEEREESVAIRILSHIAHNGTMSHEEMKAVDESVDINAIVEVLEYDGYISEHNEGYSFNSPLLKSWWSHRVAK